MAARVAERVSAAAQLVVLITGRQERPDGKAVVRGALEQAVRLPRMAEAGPYHAGPANFEAWAEVLLSEDPPALSVPPNPRPQTVGGRQTSAPVQRGESA